MTRFNAGSFKGRPILCKIVKITPVWLDCKLPTGILKTFLFVHKPSEKLLDIFREFQRKDHSIGIICAKTDDPDIFIYKSFTRYGVARGRQRIAKHIHEQHINSLVSEGLNIVRGKRVNQSLPSLVPVNSSTEGAPKKRAKSPIKIRKNPWDDPIWKTKQIAILHQARIEARIKRQHSS